MLHKIDKTNKYIIIKLDCFFLDKLYADKGRFLCKCQSPLTPFMVIVKKLAPVGVIHLSLEKMPKIDQMNHTLAASLSLMTRVISLNCSYFGIFNKVPI